MLLLNNPMLAPACRIYPPKEGLPAEGGFIWRRKTGRFVRLSVTIKGPQNSFVIEHKLNEKFVVQYSGNMGLWNDMETLGKAARLSWDNVIFMFVGGGMRKKELLNVLERPIPGHVLLFPFLSNKEYADAVSACHVALVSLKNGLQGMAVPSKIIGIMAAAIPVIAVVPDESEIATIVYEENCGLVVAPGNVNALKEAIETIKNNDKLRKQMAANGRLAFEKKYTTAIVANNYKELLTINCY